jgi:hypothetical protein
VLANGTKASKAAASKRANQKAHRIENLISMQVMAKLKDVSKFSMTSRLSILASHAKMLGIENPDNITLFRMVGIVATCDPSSSFDQEKVWDFMNTLQKFVKSGAPAKVEYLVDFPPTAELLPTDIQRNAFHDGILPPVLEWPELETCLAQFKKRGERTKSHQPLVKGKEKAKSKEAPADDSQGVDLTPLPLPSPEVFRLRADSRILPHESSLATKLAPADGEPGAASEVRCRDCGKPVETHDVEIPQLDLEAFETGMQAALDARGAGKSVMKVMKRPGMACSKAPMKAMKTMKRPSSSELPANQHTGRKPVPGWSMQRRLREYPKGCAKCAYNSPGCTPSCFRNRGQL